MALAEAEQGAQAPDAPAPGTQSRRRSRKDRQPKKTSNGAAGAPKGRPVGASGRIGGAAKTAALGPIRNGLNAYVGMMGAGLCMFPRTYPDGRTMLERGPHLTNALCDLAAENANVRHALAAFVTGGAWGGVIIASTNLVLPILAHHGMAPAAAAALPDLCAPSAELLATFEAMGFTAAGEAAEPEPEREGAELGT